MDITIKYAKLPHGLVYFYQHWVPENPKALIIMVHGLGDHIGRYSELVNRLSGKGYACALFDGRGNGRSEGRRGHVDDFYDWVGDLTSFIEFSQGQVPHDTPTFLIGGSLGALICINYLITHPTPVSGFVCVSAAIRPTIRIPEWKKKLARHIVKVLPKFSVENGIAIDRLTRDLAEQDALARDSIFHRRVTLGAAQEIEKNLELVMAMPHRIHVPTLMLAGDADDICDPEGTRQFAQRLSSQDKELKIYPGMMHDLLHDVGRETVMDDIERWIDERAVLNTPIDKQFPLHGGEVLWENVSPLA